jgi:RND family efflux transporter MFP subunit
VSLPRLPHTLLATAVVAQVLVGCGGRDEAQVPVLGVETAPVEPFRFSERLETISTLESLEQVDLAARAGGRIERLLVQEGQTVRRGQPLMALDQTQQRAQLASARAEMEANRLDFQRFEFLAEKGASSQLQRDRFREAYLKSLEDVRAREADLAFSNLRAPIDGVVSDLVVRQGDVIREGDPFTKIIRNDRLLARIEVPAVHSSKVRRGQTVLLTAPDGSGTIARGSVDFVDPNVAAGTQGLLVKAEVGNPNGILRNGLRLRSTLIFDTRDQPSVPFEAVTQSSGQSFVFTVGTLAELRANPGQLPKERLDALEALSAKSPDTRFALQTPVKMGALQDNRYPVLSGLADNSRVITSNLLRLSHGSPVKPN